MQPMTTTIPVPVTPMISLFMFQRFLQHPHLTATITNVEKASGEAVLHQMLNNLSIGAIPMWREQVRRKNHR